MFFLFYSLLFHSILVAPLFEKERFLSNQALTYTIFGRTKNPAQELFLSFLTSAQILMCRRIQSYIQTVDFCYKIFFEREKNISELKLSAYFY